jgi:hypothetical protein
MANSPIPTVIPLPAPAIPLPPPEGMCAQSSIISVEEEKVAKTLEESKEIGKEEFEPERMEASDLEIDTDETKKEESIEATKNNANFIPVAQSGDHLIRLLDETENQVEILRWGKVGKIRKYLMD